MCRMSWNLGASTSWNPQGLSRPVMGLLYLFTCESGHWSSHHLSVTIVYQSKSKEVLFGATWNEDCLYWSHVSSLAEVKCPYFNWMPWQEDAWGITWTGAVSCTPQRGYLLGRDLGWWDARVSLDVVEKGEFWMQDLMFLCRCCCRFPSCGMWCSVVGWAVPDIGRDQ